LIEVGPKIRYRPATPSARRSSQAFLLSKNVRPRQFGLPRSSCYKLDALTPRANGCFRRPSVGPEAGAAALFDQLGQALSGSIIHGLGAFRGDVARAGAGASDEVFQLVEELCRLSPEFRALWQNNEVVAHGEGVKCIHHPEAGLLDLEFSSFAVEGRPELDMIVYNPASPTVAERVRTLILAKTE